jgi:hypothetical protein
MSHWNRSIRWPSLSSFGRFVDSEEQKVASFEVWRKNEAFAHRKIESKAQIRNEDHQGGDWESRGGVSRLFQYEGGL